MFGCCGNIFIILRLFQRFSKETTIKSNSLRGTYDKFQYFFFVWAFQFGVDS